MELPFSLETKIVIASAGSARGAAQAKAARPALIPFRIGVVLPLVLVVGSFTAARSRTPARRSPGCRAACAGAGSPAAATPRPAPACSPAAPAGAAAGSRAGKKGRSEEHTSELQSLMRISYAVFCLTKKKKHTD